MVEAFVSPSAAGRLRAVRAVSRCFSLALTLGACTSFTNTPEQNLAYEHWAQCSRQFVTLRSISVDGQIQFLYTNPADGRDVVQCLSAAGRTGRMLPSPVGVRPAGGP